MRKWLSRLLTEFIRKLNKAPKEPEGVQIIIPRADFYEVWNQQYLNEAKSDTNTATDKPAGAIQKDSG